MSLSTLRGISPADIRAKLHLSRAQFQGLLGSLRDHVRTEGERKARRYFPKEATGPKPALAREGRAAPAPAKQPESGSIPPAVEGGGIAEPVPPPPPESDDTAEAVGHSPPPAPSVNGFAGKVLDFVIRNPEYSDAEIAEALDTDPSKVSVVLKEFGDKVASERVGCSKRWRAV